MRLKGIVITLVVGTLILSSCSEEATCPVTMVKPEYYIKKKVNYVSKPKRKRKPTPSLIHITRVNYKPGSGR